MAIVSSELVRRVALHLRLAFNVCRSLWIASSFMSEARLYCHFNLIPVPISASNQVSENFNHRREFSIVGYVMKAWICNLKWTRSHVGIKMGFVRRSNYANYRLNFIFMMILNQSNYDGAQMGEPLGLTLVLSSHAVHAEPFDGWWM